MTDDATEHTGQDVTDDVTGHVGQDVTGDTAGRPRTPPENTHPSTPH
ncbi:hypothetical protein ACGF07_12070 [Kitasatospora sp. NPDC048194]